MVLPVTARPLSQVALLANLSAGRAGKASVGFVVLAMQCQQFDWRVLRLAPQDRADPVVLRVLVSLHSADGTLGQARPSHPPWDGWLLSAASAFLTAEACTCAVPLSLSLLLCM